MRALNIKLWRDLWSIRGQALAIVFVIMAGVSTYVMFLSTLDSLNTTKSNYYDRYRFADVFATVKRAPESLRARIAEIDGVLRVETRVVAMVKLDIEEFPEPVTGRLLSMANQRDLSLNTLFLRQGRLAEAGRDNEVVLSETFAKAQQLNIGDKIKVIINGRAKHLTIVGLALSPEHIYQLRPGSAFPDYKRYGILWMDHHALAAAYHMQGAFNDVVIKLDTQTNPQDVIEKLDLLLEPYGSVGAYAREDQFSNRYINEELKQLGNNAKMFPAIFIAVAAFLLNVVMGRIVAMQREQIAALKAFGYGNWPIAAHYFALVLIIVFVALVFGVAAGIWLGRGMSQIYMAFFSFPYIEFVLDKGVVLQATLINTAAALVAAGAAVRHALLLQPAQAMRPEPPAKYRVSIFERLGAQRFLSQPNRMIVRNITRHPFKAMLTVLGIASACGIMMTGQFQADTVTYMLDVQYSLMKHEDLAVEFSEPTSGGALFELKRLDGVEDVEAYRRVPVRLIHEHRRYKTFILGVRSESRLQRLLDTKLDEIPIPASGLVMTDYLADWLGLKVGDEVTVEVMEGSQETLKLKLVGLAKEYIGAKAYMNNDSLNRVLNEQDAISGAYLQIEDGYLPTLFDYFKNVPRVSATLERQQEMRNFQKTMDETMIFITMVATVFSMVIALGVIYNSARIALAERSRELASLRVLGFTRGEISYILLGELVLLTVVALPLGFLVGNALCWAIAHGLQSELYRVPLIISAHTYAFAGGVVVLSSVLSGVVVRQKLDRLDLIAVLKTKE